MFSRIAVVLTSVVVLWATGAASQSVTGLAALKGLAPLVALPNTDAGKAALAANFTVTAGIQTGTIRQPTLLGFPAQQQQALRDAFITDGNLAELADGLGTTLGAAYLARAQYLDRAHFTSVSQAVADVIAYANATTGSDSSTAKYFFANGTLDGKTAASSAAGEILKDLNGSPDVFGRLYGLPAGLPGADDYGDSRPFQIEPSIVRFVGRDYFNVQASNDVYNRGPIMDLVNSPSYPSGHTTYGYMGSVLLAVLVPSRYPQMVARAAEYGNNRILMGAHYAMDVLAGRTLALHDVAHLLANDPAYLGRSLRKAPVITDFQAAIQHARADLSEALQSACRESLPTCATEDIGRFRDQAADTAFYEVTQTYDLPVVHPETARQVEDVGKIAPEAGYLLISAFPALTLQDADRILTETEGPGGGFLDDGSAFGVYSRINLLAAASRAEVLATRH